MKFKDFLIERQTQKLRNRNKIWRSAVGQPYFSSIEQRPSRYVLPYGKDISTKDFNELYHQAIVEKNKEKFKELFNYLKEKYIRIFNRKFENLPLETIEDVFQESIMKFLEREFNNNDNIEAYFRLIMKNKLYDQLRTKKRTPLRNRDHRQNLEPIDTKTPQPINLAINNELRSKIIKIIEEIVKNFDKKKVASFCFGYGLGCYENGKIKVPDNFQFGPIYKLLKTGEFSDKIDMNYIIKELAKKRIKTTKSEIAAAFFQIRNFILQRLPSDVGKQYESKLDFYKFEKILEITYS